MSKMSECSRISTGSWTVNRLDKKGQTVTSTSIDTPRSSSWLWRPGTKRGGEILQISVTFPLTTPLGLRFRFGSVHIT